MGIEQNRKNKRNNLIRCVSFSLLFAVIFAVIQNFFPDESENKTVLRMYAQEENTCSVLYIGASHTGCGISPMDIYEKYGFTGYNLSSSAQSTATTYYACREFLKTQSPQLIVVGAETLFADPLRESQYKYIMDDMRLSLNKLEFDFEYAKEARLSEGGNRYVDILRAVLSDEFVGGIAPLYRYHGKWTEFPFEPPIPLASSNEYFPKGFLFDPTVVAGEITLNDMDQVAEDEGMSAAVIPSANVEYALKLKELCEEQGIGLMFTKVPSIGDPIKNPRVWYNAKYETVKEFCELNDIVYYDMQYDDNIGIDLSTETSDGGWHLNYRGARKASDALGNFIMDHYDISTEKEKNWSEDKELYDYFANVVLLESETDYDRYLERLIDFENFDVSKNEADNLIKLVVSDSQSGYIIDAVEFDKSSQNHAVRKNVSDNDGMDSIYVLSIKYLNYLIDNGISPVHRS